MHILSFTDEGRPFAQTPFRAASGRNLQGRSRHSRRRVSRARERTSEGSAGRAPSFEEIIETHVKLDDWLDQ